VHAAPASFNSEVGLPLSVLGAPLGARSLVLEYGVNAPGEMERLLAIARPDDAWITAIAPVHLAGMGSEDAVAREKSLLAAAVDARGRVWLDHATRARLAAHEGAWRGEARPLPTLRAPGLELLRSEPMHWLLRHPRWGEIALPLVAQHEVELALAAAEIAAAHGVEPDDLRRRLAVLRRPHGRLSVHRYGELTVLDDSYNASPRSMDAALRALARWPRAGRRLAVLGTMHELGPQEESFHRSVGVRAADLPLDRVIGVAARAAGLAAEGCADVDAAAAFLAPRLRPGDAILLKASRGERLDRLLDALAGAARALPAGGAAARLRAAGGE
jgi:UDP-N-acetylmuramoyl-tripeptide--D-alanyl-D-alanine ligase